MNFIFERCIFHEWAKRTTESRSELFENNVKHNEEKDVGLNAKIWEEKKNEEDYNESVEIRTNTKIVISYR